MKALKTFLVVFFILLCTGCVKFDGKMHIHGNKSMDLDFSLAVDQDSILDSNITFPIEDFKENGYQVRTFEKGSYKGIKLQYRVFNIDRYSSDSEVVFPITSIRNEKIPDYIFQIKKGVFKNYYIANFQFDSTDVGYLSNQQDTDVLEYICDSDGRVIEVHKEDDIPSDCHGATKVEIENAKNGYPLNEEEINKNLSKDSSLTFSVVLDHKILKNNADKIKHKEAIWNLKTNGITDIHFEFELYNWANIIFIILLILVCLFFVIIGLRKILSRKEKKKKKKK